MYPLVVHLQTVQTLASVGINQSLQSMYISFWYSEFSFTTQPFVIYKICLPWGLNTLGQGCFLCRVSSKLHFHKDLERKEEPSPVLGT